jgi:phage shock protein A
MDHLEGKVEVYDLGQERSLVDEFAELETQDSVEQELQALRKRVGKDDS